MWVVAHTIETMGTHLVTWFNLALEMRGNTTVVVKVTLLPDCGGGIDLVGELCW